MTNHQSKIKIVFWGTPAFAEIILEKIIAHEGHEILAVVTAPDEPVGRKQILTSPLVKVLAEKNSLLVWQPEKLDEKIYQQLLSLCHAELDSASNEEILKQVQDDKSATIDFFIVAAYGQIIPKNILDLPKFGCLNIHPSLLPKYRGASPIQAALFHGDTETGVTIIKMDEKMDHGPKISDTRYQISETDTTETLIKGLAETGAELLLKTIPDYLTGKIVPVEQNHSQATFCKMIKKNDGQIDWQKSATEIYNQWRAFQPWPGIFTEIKKQEKEKTRIKFIELSLTDINIKKQPGELFAENNKLFVAARDGGILEIIKLQPEGKKVMTAQEFINGYLTK